MSRHSIILSFIGIAALGSAPALAQDASAPAAPSVRVGIVLPKAQLGQGNTGQDVAAPVRQLIVNYMTGPTLELVQLAALIPAQVDAEARAQNCTHVLYTSVEQKKAGKGMGGLLKAFGPAASMLPGLGAFGSASGAMVAGVATQVVAQAAMQSAQDDAMASLSQAQAGSVKAKDEISLTYQFVTISGEKPPLEATLKAKAKEDGEDLLRPLVEQLATTAVTAALGT